MTAKLVKKKSINKLFNPIIAFTTIDLRNGTSIFFFILGNEEDPYYERLRKWAELKETLGY